MIINNLEFDHADIYADLAAIQTQFHHLIRTIPAEGLIVKPTDVEAIDTMLAKGCWTPQQSFSASQGDWQLVKGSEDGSEFTVQHKTEQATVNWGLLGQHNVQNALAAMAAAHHVGVSVALAAEALSQFRGVKRRLEVRGEVKGVRVYDDFAHHPTAIKTTLAGLRANIGDKKLIAVFEPRSNTMKMGVHQQTLGASFEDADSVFMYQDADLGWSINDMQTTLNSKLHLSNAIDDLVEKVCAEAASGDYIVVMSNGGFGGIHNKLLQALSA